MAAAVLSLRNKVVGNDRGPASSPHDEQGSYVTELLGHEGGTGSESTWCILRHDVVLPA